MATLRGGVVVLHLRARAMALSVVCLFVPVLIEVGSSVFSPTAWRLWMLPSLAHSFSYFMLATLFWNLSCYAIASAASQMAEAMLQDFQVFRVLGEGATPFTRDYAPSVLHDSALSPTQRMGVRGLRAHRRVWLGLCKVLRLLVDLWGRTHTLVLGLLFVSLATLSFLLIHILLTSDMVSSLGWFAISYFMTIWSIYSICNSAQLATDSVTTK